MMVYSEKRKNLNRVDAALNRQMGITSIATCSLEM